MTQFTDNQPYNISAPQKIYIEYSHDINFDYSLGQYPDGTEEEWDWEDTYIPIAHQINGLDVGKTVFMRMKVGETDIWGMPMRLSDEITNIETMIVESTADSTFTFQLKYTFTDGSTLTTDPVTLTNGADGKEITTAEINVSGNLILTFNDGSIIDAGVAKGQDAVGIPQSGPDGAVLVIRSNVAGWEDPINVLNENLSATSPIAYTTGVLSHLSTDGNKHIPVGGSTGSMLSTDGAGNYTWELLELTLKAPDEYNAATAGGLYPVLWKARAIEEGDTFYITAAGTLGTTVTNIGDMLVAKTDTPAQTDSNWFVVESNRDQATETTLGVSKIATEALVLADTNDTDYVTPLKLKARLDALGSYKIESTSGNSFASFEPDGTNEYLSITADSLNTAQFGGAGHSKLILDPDGATGVNTGLWFGDGDTGIYEGVDDSLYFRNSGVLTVIFTSTALNSNSSSRWGLLHEDPSSTNPNIVPVRIDLDTGIGRARYDQLSLIAGGVEAQRLTEGNGRTATIMNGIVTETITNASTTIATATLTKTGENFLTTVNPGDIVLVYGGTTTADYGTYEVELVNSDTQITIDRNFIASNTDVDFDIISNGTIVENSTTDGISTLHTPKIHFTNKFTSGAFAEGEVMWNSNDNTLDLKTGYGTTLQVGQELHIKVYNNSGGVISEGTAVYPTGSFNNYPTISKAITNTHENTEIDFGMTTSHMENNSWGFVTWFGKVNDLDTSAYSLGDVIYISSTTAGEVTNIKPIFPDYAIQIGIIFVVHATTGQIFVTGRNTPRETILSAWDGSIREGFDFTVSSTGTVVTGLLENKDNTRNLTLMFSDGFTMFDTTTTPSTETLTPGTDSVPTTNYVYIPILTKALTVNTTGFPLTEHCKVAQLEVQSAATVLTEGGAERNQNINDHLKTVGNNGHLLHIAERVRQLNAEHDNGTEGSLTGTPTNGYIQVTSGGVWQMHNQTVNSFSMPTRNIIIVNDFTTANLRTNNLNSISAYSDGNTWNNQWSKVIIWGIANKSGEPNFIKLNLPSNGYNSEAAAIADSLNYANYTIPKKYKGVGFLIAAFSVRISGGTITYNGGTAYQDLRGFVPNNIAGGGGASGVTSFLGLTDTPISYVGEALKIPQVNIGENALEFNILAASDISDFDTEVANNSAVVLNTAKLTNVTTDLSEGTSTETTVDVNSSDGTNAILVSASASRAGLLTKAKYDEIVLNTAKITTQWITTGSNIYYNTGNVGIGTTDPLLGKVQIEGSTGQILTIRNNIGSNSASTGEVRFITDATTRYSAIRGWRFIASNKHGLKFITQTVADIELEAMILDPDGNLGIGTSTIPAKVTIDSIDASPDMLRVTASSTTQSGNDIAFFGSQKTASNVYNLMYVGYGTGYTTSAFEIKGDGSIFMPQVYSDAITSTRDIYMSSAGQLGYVSSSKRYKENIVALELNENYWRLRPVTFDYIDETQGLNQNGLIAEEVEEQGFNYLCSYNEDGTIETVNYSKLGTYNLAANLELKKELEVANTKIEILEAQLELIKNHLNL